jgi:hypothetical protein
MVSLIERDHANVSFCSNHILGTALPPPSVGGLRPNSPVTCGFSTSRLRSRAAHAPLAREPPGSLGRRELAPRRAAATCRFRGCSVRAGSHLLCSPRRHASAGVGRNLLPPSRPRWRRLTLPLLLQALGLRPPRALWSRLASFISELASMRCPGSGLQRSRRLSASKPLRPPWRSRGTTASPHSAGGGDPASAATATCSRTQAETWAISTRTKAPEGLESCRRGGAS